MISFFPPVSLEDVRKECILSYLNNQGAGSGRADVNIYLTGKTSSGKTTFENLLIAAKLFEEAPDTDTTKSVQVKIFHNGLKVFDLPGSKGDPLLENINRAALGLPLSEGEEQPLKVPLTTLGYGNQMKTESIYTLAEYVTNPYFKPHLVYYLISSTDSFQREESYVTALLKKQQVIFIINEYDRADNTASIQDITVKLNSAYAKSGASQSLTICRVNCLTGRGLKQVFEETGKRLDSASGKIFQEMLWHQYLHTPVFFRKKLIDSLVSGATVLARHKPDESHDGGPVLESFELALWTWYTQLLKQLGAVTGPRPTILARQTERFNERHTKPVMGPKFKIEVKEHNGGTIEHQVPDGEELKGYTYEPFGMDDGVRLIAGALLAYRLSEYLDWNDDGLKEMFDQVLARGQEKDAVDDIKSLIRRLLYQFFGEDFQQSEPSQPAPLQSHFDRFLRLPYIFYFNAEDHAILSSLGTKLNWETDNASTCSLKVAGSREQVPLREADYTLKIFADTPIELSVQNNFGEAKARQTIRVFPLPHIKNLDLNGLSVSINPLAVHNPAFDLGAQLHTSVHMHNPLRLSTGAGRKDAPLPGQLHSGYYENSGMDEQRYWQHSWRDQLQTVVAASLASLQHLREQIQKLYKQQRT